MILGATPPPTKWKSHFSDLLGKGGKQSDENMSNELSHLERRPHFGRNDRTISKEEVCSSIRRLKINKSPGPDGIISELVRYSIYSLLDPFCKIVNLIFRATSYPTPWTLV